MKRKQSMTWQRVSITALLVGLAVAGPWRGVSAVRPARAAGATSAAPAVPSRAGTYPPGLLAALQRHLGHGHRAQPEQTAAASPATTWRQQAELTVPNTGGLGYAVAISGSTAIATAPDIGAFVFVRHGTSWSQQAKLTPPGGTSGYFGGAVALSGDTAVVGAPGSNGRTGATYVFVRNGTTWSQQAVLSPTTPLNDTQFGISVAINANTILVGTESYRRSGAAYVFVHSGTSWIEEARLTANHPGAIDYFGHEVALSGNTALISGLTGTGGVGAAYVFVRSGTTWSQQAIIIDPTGQASDNFGASVALNGNTAIVATTFSGVMYAFVRSGTTWSEQQAITSTYGLGSPVALSGNTAIVEGGGNNGYPAVDVFVRSGSTWSEQAILTGSCATSRSTFGRSVGLNGNAAIVGADGPGGCGEKGAAHEDVRS